MTDKQFPLVSDDEIMLTEMPHMNLYDELDLNGIDLQQAFKKWGAEIIRLWVAASDYSGDIAGDDKIMARVIDGYRRIRNILRFLLANVSDFDAEKDAVPFEQLTEIDRWALTRAAALQSEFI